MKVGGRTEERHAGSHISVHCLDGAFHFEVAGTATTSKRVWCWLSLSAYRTASLQWTTARSLLTLAKQQRNACEAGAG
jgi:hypothetical protein